jgi:hypothetical protein
MIGYVVYFAIWCVDHGLSIVLLFEHFEIVFNDGI